MYKSNSEIRHFSNEDTLFLVQLERFHCTHTQLLYSLVFSLFSELLCAQLSDPPQQPLVGGGREHQAGANGGGARSTRPIVEQLVEVQHCHLV